MDAAARKRKSREKLKQNPEKLRMFLEKERERDTKRRDKLRTILLKSKQKLETTRLANRIRQRKCREKKKTMLLQECIPISPLGSYKCKQTLSKAVKKSEKTLPPSPTKSQAVVFELAKRILPPGTINTTKNVEAPKRSDSIPEETLNLVESFFNSDEVSRQTPNRKDVIRVKDNEGNQKTVPKRHLVMTVAEVYELFRLTYPDVKIKRTKFFELRPFHVRVMSEMPHNVCVCVYHANFQFMVEALKDVLDAESPSQVLNAICCDTNNEICMTGKCRSCYNISDIMKLNVELNSLTQWKKWDKSPEGWLQIQTIRGSKQELLQEIEAQLPKYKTHCYVKREQSQFFEKSRLETSDTDGVMQIDFAENFSIISQDEIQSAHWRHPQVTLFTCCVWLQKGQKVASYIVVSEVLSHDKTSVWIYLKLIIEHLMIDHPALKKLIIFSDGCAAQFKNRYTISSVFYSTEDWGVKVDWVFFATSHGKGAVDGLGAVAKRRLWNAIKARKITLNNSRDCYEFLVANPKGVTYLFFSADDPNFDQTKNDLELRWQDLDLFPGLQKHHYFTFCGGKDISYGLTVSSMLQTTSLKSNKLNFRDVYSDSETEIEENNNSDEETLETSLRSKEEEIAVENDNERVEEVSEEDIDRKQNEIQAGSSGLSTGQYDCGNFVLVKFAGKRTEYRYAGIINYIDSEEGEVTVTYLRVSGDSGRLFKIEKNDVSDVTYEQIIKKLPLPELIKKGKRVFYRFNEPIDVYEQ